MTLLERANAFRALHERSGAFVIPNPWDAGSARVMQGLGFEALATTSSGFAQTLARLDGRVSADEKLAHCTDVCAAVRIPVSADLENCFADSPAGAAAVLTQAGSTGIVGGTIEDYSNDPQNPMYDFDLAVERVHAAVEAVSAFDFPFMLTARAEGLLRRAHDMDEIIRRLQAFEKVGADVLYAPGLTTLDEVRIVTEAVTKPVNVWIPPFKGVTVDELAAAGAKRLSTGGALARLMLGSLMQAGNEMLQQGTFNWTTGMASGDDFKQLLE
jgi:2-methylisocitrate lyase-like PEP mutase family enzyme